MNARDKLAQTALKRAIGMLTAVGCQYKIITPDGKQYGTLITQTEPTPDEGRQAQRKPNRGRQAQHIKPYLEGMQVGDVTQIPCGEYTLSQIQAGASNVAARLWGRASIISNRNHAQKCVDMMRIN